MLFGFGFSPGKPKKAGGVATDPDAEAFFTATGITDATQKSAVNQLVLDLKSYNIWTNMIALYPIVGGSASSHAVNLKTPGTYNLTFSTGWTHASTGATPNGTSAFGNTSLQTANIGLNSGHMSFYSRTNNTKVAVDIGSFKSGVQPSYSYIYTYFTSPTIRDFRYCENATLTRLSSPTRTDGFFVVSRTSNTTNKGFRNGSIEASSTSSTASFTSTLNNYIGAYNNDGTTSAYSNREIAFASLGTGLTDSDVTNFNTAISAFQTTLARNI
jgi:hypothetical protein